MCLVVWFTLHFPDICALNFLFEMVGCVTALHVDIK